MPRVSAPASREPRLATIAAFPVAIAWAAGGRVLAIAGDDGTVELLDGETGTSRSRIAAHDGPVQSLAWHPRRDALLTTGQDGAAYIWENGDRRTLLERGATWAEHACWSASGERAAIAVGPIAHVIAPGAPPITTEPVESTIAALAFTPSGKSLGVACYGGVQLLDPKSGRVMRRLEWKGSMLSIAFSPDGSTVACGCQDNSVHFWRIATGKDAQMSGYPAKPRAIAYSHDGRWLATGGDATICLWPFDKKGPEGRTPVQLEGHRDLVTCLAYAPLVDYVISGSKDGSVALWAPPKLTRPVTTSKLDGKVTAVAFGAAPEAGVLRWAAAADTGRVLIGAL